MGRWIGGQLGKRKIVARRGEVTAFLAQAARYPSHNNCVLWPFATVEDGYGCTRRVDGEVRAHRIVWARTRGRSAKGKVIRHTCDQPRCVNPRHLRAGTQLQNIRDRTRRGRSNRPVGERNPSAVLTWAKVREIRRRASQGERGAFLARLFAVTPANISEILLRKSWCE